MVDYIDKHCSYDPSTSYVARHCDFSGLLHVNVTQYRLTTSWLLCKTWQLLYLFWQD